uniref:Uncharacterized protein n=1 Tax=Anguilla anguilla TaxID=7936 RepID=A0A0E9T0X6_ANGAN
MKVCITAILTWLTALPSLLHFVSGEQPIDCLRGPMETGRSVMAALKHRHQGDPVSNRFSF